MFVSTVFASHQGAPGVSLLDLMQPDDVMLRKPSQPSAASKAAAEAAAKAKAAEEAAAQAEAKRREEAAARAQAEAEAKRREEAAARAQAEAEAKRRAEEARRAAEAKAAEEAAARAKAEAEAKAAEEAAARAEAKRRSEEEARKAAEARLPPKLTAPAGAQPDVLETKKTKHRDKKAAKEKKKTGRDAVITAERTDYDRKEGVVLFDRNVYVDDEQYQLHADRLFLFLDGTNDLKRLVALGSVSITNEEKNASCARAVFVKKLSKIVMYGEEGAPARLYQGGKKGGNTVMGERITFWLNSEQVEIEKPVVTVPGGSFRSGDGKDLFKNMKK